MRKRLLVLVIALVGLLGLAACGSSDEEKEGSSDKEKTYKIGATQIVEHPSLNEAFEGFKKALDDKGVKYEVDFQNAQGDQSNVATISNNFVAANVDLIFANSTPSALGALQATEDIPIVFTSVTDAVEAGLIESMDAKDTNVTGVLDLHPDAIEKTVEFIDENFEGAKVGLLYNAGEQNSIIQIEAIEEAVEGTSLSVSKRTVANSAEVQQAANTLIGDVDVLYIITDNTVVSALDTVVDVANNHEVPLVVGEPDSLEKGAFATFGIDYHTIGYRSGEMAADILTGEAKVEDIEVEYPADIQLFINKDAADKQGVKWNEDWDKNAEIIGNEND